MFPMTITLQNTAQLNAVLAALSLGTAAAAEPTTAQLTEMAQARGQATKEATTAGKSAKAGTAPGPTTATKDAAPEKTAGASDPAAGSAAAEPQGSTAATEVTYDVVAKAITERAKSDRGAVIATLETFGAKKGTELKPAQYADFLKALG